MNCTLDRARIALGEGQTALTENLLKKAIEVIKKQRSSIKTQTGRIGFVGDKQTARWLIYLPRRRISRCTAKTVNR